MTSILYKTENFYHLNQIYIFFIPCHEIKFLTMKIRNTQRNIRFSYHEMKMP